MKTPTLITCGDVCQIAQGDCVFNAEAQRTQRKRREHNSEMSSLRFLRVLCVSAFEDFDAWHARKFVSK